MGNLFEKVDRLGEEFKINYGKSAYLQTKIGGVLTIFFSLAITATTFIFISNFLNTENSEVSTNAEFDPTYPKINIIDSQMSPIFAILKNSKHLLNPKEISRYLTFRGVIIENNYSSENVENFEFETKEKLEIPFKPCSNVRSNQTKWYLESAQVKNIGEFHGICPEVENKDECYIGGSIISPPQRQFLVQIFPCSLKDKTQCATPAEMLQFSIYVFLPNYSFDRKNYENPVKMSPGIAFKAPINYEFSNVRDITWKQKVIYDDRMDFFPAEVRKRYTEIDSIDTSTQPRIQKKIHCTKKEIDNSSCIPYVQLAYSTSGKIVHITRSYKKILTVLGEIGGTSKTLLVFASTILILTGGFCLRKKKARHILDMEVEEAKTLLKNEGKRGQEFEMCFWKVVKEYESQNHDGFEFIRNSNKFQILDELIFKPQHRKLVPLLLLNRTKERMCKKKIWENEGEGNTLSIQDAVKKIIVDQTKEPFEASLNSYFLDHLPKNLVESARKTGGEKFSNLKLKANRMAKKVFHARKKEFGASKCILDKKKEVSVITPLNIFVAKNRLNSKNEKQKDNWC